MTKVSRCTACGVFVQSEDSFCWSCGARIGNVQGTSEPPPGPRIREPEPETALALRRAQLAHQRNRPAEAERIVLEVLAREPDSVPALSMMSEILRARGDLVGAVAAAQKATDAASDGSAPPGFLAKAREERAHIEKSVVRQLSGSTARPHQRPLSALLTPGAAWYRAPRVYLALCALGLAGLLLATVAALRGQFVGYLWLGASLFAAGWAYNDAEARRLDGLFWGALVLCLGPFGLAVYLLATY